MSVSGVVHLVDVVVARRMAVAVTVAGTRSGSDAPRTGAGARTVAAVTVVLLAVHLRMVGVSNLLHDRIEAVVLVGRVLDDARGAVGLLQRVGALHQVAVAMLPLVLVVAGVRVLDAVLELVLRVRLRNCNHWNHWNNWMLIDSSIDD